MRKNHLRERRRKAWRRRSDLAFTLFLTQGEGRPEPKLTATGLYVVAFLRDGETGEKKKLYGRKCRPTDFCRWPSSQESPIYSEAGYQLFFLNTVNSPASRNLSTSTLLLKCELLMSGNFFLGKMIKVLPSRALDLVFPWPSSNLCFGFLYSLKMILVSFHCKH